MKWEWSGYVLNFGGGVMGEREQRDLNRIVEEQAERIRELQAEVRSYREALATFWRILAPFPNLGEPQP